MAHERAVIMALTFIIGFTTGLIAYGLPAKDMPLAYVAPISQTASVLEAVTTDVGIPTITQRTAQPVVASNSSTVEVDDTGLYVVNQGGERLLVSVAEGVDPDLDSVAHIEIHQPLVSPTGDYLFFCAERAQMEGTCDALVYVVANNSLRPVTVPTLQVPATMRVAWASDGRLQINQQVSFDASEPWVVN